MSPEQATGDQTVGPATDTYALGCVLYEMLVGEPPFTGSSPQAILGKTILGSPESVRDQRPSVPTNVEAAISKALERLPADRFTSALDFAGALTDSGTIQPGPVVSATPHRTARALSAGVVIGIAVAGLAFWATTPYAAPDPQVTRLVLTPPTGEMLSRGAGRGIAISPDGRRVAYVAGQRIYLQDLEKLGPVALPGTEGVGSLRGGNLTFSPDGEWVAFTAAGQLKRVSASGG
ncbi:MAG: PD40 domain-containing protein [Gemmatimonadetes bacterium]|nr:PD40 domain-containing protein [Gemmatimonadota bacterium]